jgi:tetratricopeptide (TPR) repeat protein
MIGRIWPQVDRWLAVAYMVLLFAGALSLWRWVQDEPNEYDFNRAVVIVPWAMAQGNLELAWQTLNALPRSAVTTADHFYRVGLLYLQLDDMERAVEYFQTAITVDPDLWGARYHLGSYLVREGKWEEGLAQLAAAQKGNPEWGATYYWMGVALERQEKYAEAFAMYIRATRAEVSFGGALSAATAIMGKMSADEALDLFTWASTTENNGEIQYALADLLLKKGEIDRALPHLELAAKLSPERWQHHARLGGALVVLRRDEDAIPVLRRAAAMKEDYAPTFFSLGLALERQGDLSGAREAYTRATELDANLKGVSEALERVTR